MAMTFKVAKAYFDAQGLKNQVIKEDSVLRVGFNADNKDQIEVIVIFDENDRTVALRSFHYVKYPDAKLDAMYRVCSQLNNSFRWVKFYVNEEDNSITMADDAVVQIESCGEEISELVLRMVSIGDDAYPKFMQAIYAS